MKSVSSTLNLSLLFVFQLDILLGWSSGCEREIYVFAGVKVMLGHILGYHLDINDGLICGCE